MLSSSSSGGGSNSESVYWRLMHAESKGGKWRVKMKRQNIECNLVFVAVSW